MGKIKISGTGCALADYLYTGIRFSGPEFRKHSSKKAGDGGLSPGKLVFTEELESFSGKPYKEILREIAGDRPPSAFNVGGPSLVSMIHVSQMLDRSDFDVKFFGMAGQDETSEKIFNILRKTPLIIDNYLTTSEYSSPFTDVLSDQEFADGHGERTFINNIGAAWGLAPEYLTEDFFSSDIVCFGGTALVPHIHDNLTSLLLKAKRNNCKTIVNTVYDFRNEKRYSDNPWPLVDDTENYRLIDILIMDCEEAKKISGQKSIEEAAEFFSSTGVASFIITNGPDNIYAKSLGGLFEKTAMICVPVSFKVLEDLKSSSDNLKDTTGCGDNFAGGIIASVAEQSKKRHKGALDLIEALSMGVASGGLTCFIAGGTFIEKYTGEKRSKVMDYKADYLKQIKR